MTKQELKELFETHNVPILEHPFNLGADYIGKLDHHDFLIYGYNPDSSCCIREATKLEAPFVEAEGYGKTEEEATKDLEKALLEECDKFLAYPKVIPVIHYWAVEGTSYIDLEDKFINYIKLALAIELK